MQVAQSRGGSQLLPLFASRHWVSVPQPQGASFGPALLHKAEEKGKLWNAVGGEGICFVSGPELYSPPQEFNPAFKASLLGRARWLWSTLENSWEKCEGCG